jgi:hypothetical protein
MRKTLIIPIVIYGAESLTMTKTISTRQAVFEHKILRINGPVKQGYNWRISCNEEVYNNK